MHAIGHTVCQVLRFGVSIKNHSHFGGYGVVSHNRLMRHVKGSLSTCFLWDSLHYAVSQLIFDDLLIFFFKFLILD